jgi:acyl-CoA synthetase (NDP forming)
VPAYIFPESAARALSAMWKYAQRKQIPDGTVKSFEVDDDEIARIIAITREQGRTKVSEPDALRILEAAGIRVEPWRFVEGGEDLESRVRSAAGDLGFPVVLKVVSQEISHKSDVGGIEIGIGDADECDAALGRIVQKVTGAGYAVEGLLVQGMAHQGIETIVGMTRNPRMPPMVMFGLGGIYVEVMKDVVLRLCPVRDSDAAEMVKGVKMRALLDGVRGEAPRDLAALEDAIQRVSQLCLEHPAIKEMDVNPLLSLAEGATAIDARISIAE